jgi:8-oxo-dGTP pyrophosphatase MutT (NUDIX family)
MKKAAIIAIGRENKWLVVKRAPTDPVPGFWEFPGGSAKDGEAMESAARREMEEETSLSPASLSHIGKSIIPFYLKPSESFELHHFLCQDFEGEPKLCAEHSDFKWLEKEEIPKLGKISPGTLRHLKLLQDKA